MSVKVSSWAWSVRCPPGDKLTLLAMADYADDDGGNVFPAVKTLAKKTGKSKRAVQYSLRNLEGLGLIEVVGVPGDDDIPTQQYRITMRGDAKSAPGAKSALVQKSTRGGAKIDKKGRNECTQTIKKHQEPARAAGKGCPRALLDRDRHIAVYLSSDIWSRAWGEKPTDGEIRSWKESRAPPRAADTQDPPANSRTEER